jgi:hypothetical protein
MPARFTNTCWNAHEADTRCGIVAGKLERGFIRPVDSAVLDGEAVVLRPDNLFDF